jgi:Zn-dependent protease with chaperone function
MRVIGPGVYFDGITSARHEVEIELLDKELEIRIPQGRLLTIWPNAKLERLTAPEHILRLGLRKHPALARLETGDAVLAQAIRERCASISHTGGAGRQTRLRVAAWGALALVMVGLAAIFGVPALANRVAPLLPQAFERKLGNLVDGELRSMLDSRGLGGAFECGTGVEQAGRAALEKLVGRLSAAADFPGALQVAVIRRPENNAVALPGGRIYVFQGLVAKASTADELAGVIAHEIGHVVRRDGTRAILQGAGLSFLLGMVLGDVAGGSAVVTAATIVLRSSYAREVEAAADRYAVELMRTAQADTHALGSFLARLADDRNPAPKLFRDHPETQERIAAINSLPVASARIPLLGESDWSALKRICDGRP